MKYIILSDNLIITLINFLRFKPTLFQEKIVCKLHKVDGVTNYKNEEKKIYKVISEMRILLKKQI